MSSPTASLHGALPVSLDVVSRTASLLAGHAATPGGGTIAPSPDGGAVQATWSSSSSSSPLSSGVKKTLSWSMGRISGSVALPSRSKLKSRTLPSSIRLRPLAKVMEFDENEEGQEEVVNPEQDIDDDEYDMESSYAGGSSVQSWLPGMGCSMLSPSRSRAGSSAGSLAGGSRIGGRGTTSCSSTGLDRQLQLSRQLSIAKSKNGKSEDTLIHMAMADEPMAILPWCGQCDSQRPYASLPLLPAEMETPSNFEVLFFDAAPEQEPLRRHALAGPRNNSKGSAPAGPRSNSKEHFKVPAEAPAASRIVALRNRVSLPLHWDIFGSGMKPASVSAIRLTAPPLKSRFSKLQHKSPCLPVLERLTVEEVGLLERWMLQHIKAQYIQVSAAAQALAPKEETRHNDFLMYATLANLLSRHTSGDDEAALDEREKSFMYTKLHTVPLLSELPYDFLCRHAQKIKVCSFVRGDRIFTHKDTADSLYILAQGTVELFIEDSNTFIPGSVKKAPCVLLEHDVIQKDNSGRPFVLRPRNERKRSRSARTIINDEESTTAMVLLCVGPDILKALNAHCRDLEQSERNNLVKVEFSRVMGSDPERCSKHASVFTLDSYDCNTILHQEGHLPDPKTAKLFLIIQGEVRLVHPLKKEKIRGRRYNTTNKENLLPGKLIGTEAIYGEPYKCSAVVASDRTRLLSLHIIDYLDRFLYRRVPLQRRTAAAEEQSENGSPAAEHENDEAERDNGEDWTRAIFEAGHQEMRQKGDLEALKTAQWKKLRHKRELPSKRLPKTPRPKQAASLIQSDGQDVVQGSASVQRERMPSSIQTSISPDCEKSHQRSITSGISTVSTSLGEQSLTRRLALASITTKRIEVEHRSHSTYGYHIEDATGGFQPSSSSVLLAPPGSAVLFTCGSLHAPNKGSMSTASTADLDDTERSSATGFVRGAHFLPVC